MLRAWVPLLAVVFAVSCGGGGSESAERPTDEPPCTPAEREGETKPLAGTLTCTLEADIAVEVSGAEEFTHETTTVLAINEFYQGDLPETTWFANVGMGAPVNITESVLHRVSFDIAPGTYEGEGTYELTSERPDVEGLSSPLTDNAQLQVTKLEGEAPDVAIYAGFAEPCRLEVRDHLTRGRLRCPALADEQGDTVSLEFRWRPAQRQAG